MSDEENNEEINDASFAPDGEADDYEAILGGDNSSAFIRYAVPPQFDGNSSDEGEQPDTGLDDEVKDPQEAEEYVEEVTEDQGYAPLVADEFGEFVSSEDFGDYYTPDNVVPLSVLAAGAGRAETKQSEADGTPIPAVSRPENVRVSIPPLDANKIQTIKAAMAKMDITPPNIAAMAFADTLERCKLRVGDEITE